MKTDKEKILQGEKLNDLVINTAQLLLKNQFPSLLGMCCSLIQNKQNRIPINKQQLQIIHSIGNHWLVASTIYASTGVVNVYDSVFNMISKETENIIYNQFDPLCSLEIVNMKKQHGGNDCGVYAIAVSTALAFNLDPASIIFDQGKMRSHLVQCIEKEMVTPFPSYSV